MFIITQVINWLKRQIRDQFGFTKAETNGVLVLLILIGCFLMTPCILKWYYNRSSLPTYETDVAFLDSILVELNKQQLVPKKTPQKKENNAIPQKTKPYKKHKDNPKILQSPSFDINTADSRKLETLPGIGPARSARIIKYRNQLGGFVGQQQYQEIYGLDSLSIASMLQYAYITPTFQPRKIDINQASFKTLLAHPYLSYAQVQRIFQFRNKRGRFKRIEELLENQIVEKATFEKVKDYLKL